LRGRQFNEVVVGHCYLLNYPALRLPIDSCKRSIVSLGEQTMTAVEALIRWRSAELGQVSPADFIPLAEETGLILPIGEWVLWTACRQAKIWYDQGYTRFKVSVNLSARQLQGEALLELVSMVLAETGLPAVCLQLEITESVAMADVGLTYDLISRLRAMGVQIAIDDFGTSYSSLGYLKRFPVSGIKIDRSFIKDVGKTEDANAIASAIIAMAHILGLAVTAEGVETAEQLAFLQAHQCDAIQGFLISAALPAEDVINLANVVIPRSLGVECIA
ncbi:MAG TPA: EAL domain-containing protein, partial [Leptolyngbyaceae cyanobacterium]